MPLHWSSTSNILWKTPVTGESWSSPIVWQDRVFVTTALDHGESCRVLSIHSSSGQILWNKEVFRQMPRHKQARNTFATPTPVTDGEQIIACFGDGSFAALNFAGDILWTNRIYPFYGEHGLGTSPILQNGLLVMARDGSNEGEDKKLGVAEALGPGPACLPWMRKQGKERWEGVSGACHAFRMAVRISGNMTVNPKSSRRRAMFCKDSIFGPVNDCGPMKLSAKGRFLRWCWVTGWHSRPEVGVEKKRLRPFDLEGTGDLKETNLVWEQKKGMSKVPSMLYVKPRLIALSDGGCGDLHEG